MWHSYTSKAKWYVVWVGEVPGVYRSWSECETQVKGYPGASFKSFTSREEAEVAFQSGVNTSFSLNRTRSNKSSGTPLQKDSFAVGISLPTDGLAVDAACSGNPGSLEYRAVWISTGEQAFHKGPFEEGTNNIGEFLAIIEGLKLLANLKLPMILYTDSQIAIGWVKKKKANTTLVNSSKTKALFAMIEEGQSWLSKNSYSTPIEKWKTKLWGEIPADFGRK
jgi:ribonuclease HI